MTFNRTIILLLLCIISSYGQHPYWVFFEDDPLLPNAELTAQAEERLFKRGISQNQASRIVSQDYLDQLRSAGFKIRHSSRFLNAASVEIETLNQIDDLLKLPFIKNIQAVAVRSKPHPLNISDQEGLTRPTEFSYGQSYTQNQMFNIPGIHNKGYDGSGVIVAVFDTGFLTEHPAFDGMDILAQYDFVDNEIDASGVGHGHGINVLSALGGYFPGELIGPAYAASYLLARTEDYINESRAEEDNWVAALEWADSLGVDIISSSLNYKEFDDGSQNYPDSAIDGQTAIITIAANIAAERGILVVNSAANEGPGSSSIWPPADSPHVLAVGSINAYDRVSSFSSRGPTYDGRIKPDVVALGISVHMASGVSGFAQGSGTSFAAPLVSGLAALLLQAHPELSPDSIISIFQTHSDRSDNPDNDYGYGLPDLSGFFTTPPIVLTPEFQIYPNPCSISSINVSLPEPIANHIHTCRVYNIRGSQIAILNTEAVSTSLIEILLPTGLNDQMLFLQMEAGNKTYSGKLLYLNN